MAIKRLEAVALGELLGSLLGSVVDAQAQAARATVGFVEDVGFESTPEGDKLRTVKVRYTKKDENDQMAEFEVEVPLLAMVNVPSLTVRQAKLSFSYDVVTQAAAASSSSGTGSSSILAARPQAARLTGFVRSKPSVASDSTPAARRTTSVDLDVTLEQQEVPLGVERLFDLAELGISETPTDGGGGG